MTEYSKKQPKTAIWILSRISDPIEKDSIIGDFSEIFFERENESGKIRALLWLWQHIILSLPSFIKKIFFGSGAMFKNYFKIAYRNITRQKIYSTINILGLSIGLSFCILIYLYISNELSYDNFHEKAERIFAVVGEDNFHKSKGVWSTVSMGPALEETFPEIDCVVRWNSMFQGTVRYQNKVFNEFVVFTDPEFFEVFSFKLISGDPTTVLNRTDSIVLTESTAEKYYGENDPIGKILSISIGDFTRDFEITGISEDAPGNSSIGFRFLINIENLRNIRGPDYLNNWWFNDSKSFALLKEGVQVEEINNRMDPFTREKFAKKFEERKRTGTWDGTGMAVAYYLYNIKDLHLEPELLNTVSANIKNTYILAGIAFLILFIACINFINLSIGRASGRAVEMGMRKVMGAERIQLVRQFWSESFLITSISLAIGMFLAAFLVGTFSSLAGKKLYLSSIFDLNGVSALIVLVVSVSVFAGFVPSLFITKFHPVDIIKGKFRIGGKNILTKTLVVVQFGLSVFFLISTFIMTGQIGFLVNSDPGFDRDGIVYIDTQESGWAEGEKTTALVKLYKERLGSRGENILNISGCFTGFNRNLSSSHFRINDEMTTVFVNKVYYDYIKTSGIDLSMGRDFSPQFASDTTAIIVNRAFLDEYRISEPIGKMIEYDDGSMTGLKIIGVVENYNFMSLRNRIEPVILTMIPEMTIKKIIVKISGTNIVPTIKRLEAVWSEIQPDKPFQYTFLDEDIERAYFNEKRWSTIVKYSSVFAILITCMGIFGLTSIIVNRRIKEIGIRKVLGAAVSGIVMLITREFIILTAAANIIAWPISYFVMDRWLQGFAYRVDIGGMVFILSAFIAVFITLITIAFQSVKAALVNPVSSLRYE